ncbi:hypothetical protein ACTI_60410 [Actinoplanes sp. OR16]|nr:hypothetical protein ACTI_60410 [Actinoplanes sp. OR16]
MAACALVLSPAAPVAAAAGGAVTIGYPADGQTVGAGPLTVTGSVALGGAQAQVVYAVDVSGSTASAPGEDCSGDGVVTAELDDFNQDESVGDTLDCEISGVVSLTAALRAVPGAQNRITVGLIGFGDDAVMADLDPGTATTAFTAPGASGGDSSEDSGGDAGRGRGVVPRITAVAGSLTRGTIGRETPQYAGSGTGFQRPLDVAATAFTTTGPRWIFLLSDGLAPVPDTSAVVAAGVRVRTFAVGTAATCAKGSALAVIAAATGEVCVRVEDPSRLRSGIGPAGIREVTVERDGRPPFPATVDGIGDFAAPVGTIGTGVHRIVVRVVFSDGRTAEARRWFTGRSGTRYVALGDSFSAGEGLEPYDDLLCHRSAKAWPSQIRLPGGREPVASDVVACSGARVVNAGTRQMTKTYHGRPTAIPLQNTSLGTDADLVTLTFGGDDVGFAEILMHCATRSRCMDGAFIEAGGRSVSLDDWTRVRIALAQNELGGLYRQIRSRVRPDTTIVAATYPHPLRIGRRPCAEGTLIAEDERRWIAGRIDEFDDAMLERAPGSGVLVADVRKDFAGHAVCDRDSWIGGLRTRRATDLSGDVTGAASFRPGEEGARRYAAVVSRRIAARPAALPAYRMGWRSDGGASAAESVAKPGAAAVRAAQRAEGTARTGPIRTAVSPALRAATRGSAFPAPVRAKRPPVPDALRKAVAATRITPVVVGDAAAMRHLRSCGSDVVRTEHVPFAAEGFTARSAVTIRLTGERAKDRTLATVTADDQGRATGWVRMPPDLPTGTISGLEVRGPNPAKGTTLGFAVLRGTDRSACVAHARKAGLLAATPPSLDSSAATRPPMTGAEEPGALPRTGDPGWLFPAALTGIAMIALGSLLVTATIRRRVR